MISISMNRSIMQLPKTWRKLKSPAGNRIIKGWIKCQFIEIKEENFVISMALLKYNRHSSDS